MVNTHQQTEEDDNIPEWIAGFTLGASQVQLERFAASFGVSARSLAARLGTILSGASSRAGLGFEGSMPELLRHSRNGSSLPEPLALARRSSSSLRTHEAPKNGKLEKGAFKRIVLAAIRDNGPAATVPFLHSLHEAHPHFSLASFNGTINRLKALGFLKKGRGTVKLTARGQSAVDALSPDDNPPSPPNGNGGGVTIRHRRNMSASARRRIAEAQRQRWAAQKNEVGKAANGNKKPSKRTYTTTGARPSPMRDAVIAALAKASAPILRAHVIERVREANPKMSSNSIGYALDNGVTKGYFIRSDDGYKVAKNRQERSKAVAARRGNKPGKPTITAIRTTLERTGTLKSRKDVIEAVQKQHPQLTHKAVENALIRGVKSKLFEKTAQGFALAAAA